MRHLNKATNEWYMTCDWCDMDVIVWISSPAGEVQLCMEHLKSRIPSVEWLENNLRPRSDHLDDALERAFRAQLANPKAMV